MVQTLEMQLHIWNTNQVAPKGYNDRILLTKSLLKQLTIISIWNKVYVMGGLVIDQSDCWSFSWCLGTHTLNYGGPVV